MPTEKLGGGEVGYKDGTMPRTNGRLLPTRQWRIPRLTYSEDKVKERPNSKVRHITNAIYRIVPRIGSLSDLPLALYKM